MNADVLLPEKIRIEEKFHPLTLGGHIFHAFMGESYADPDALMSLTNKIAKKLRHWILGLQLGTKLLHRM